ncbi:MAG: hypothetical protein QN152_10485 [Armatimonadota bacterium]|nr:hypothetical protein [Armatimonadota bacterium]MDR7426776.1 hypothetical protein [Armatimonadota bacterium]MDR7465447.1 hypothetical protein [Armatimonadota bacterium]MDR7469866.1 hypothetical protein [Armatimonadota bacterium]MDR7474326.1 hypothetical protein [Armatimonadota bacterium]
MEVFNTMMVPERLASTGGALGGARAALEVAVGYRLRIAERPAPGE